MAEPIRTCIGCGERLPARALVRLVLEGDGVVAGRRGVGGRGAWIHAAGECIERAVRRKAFARAFRRSAAGADVPALRLLLTGSTRKN